MKNKPPHRPYSFSSFSRTESEDLSEKLPHAVFVFYKNAISALLRYSDELGVHITDELIGEATQKGLLDVKEGALLPYSVFKYYFGTHGYERSIAVKRWKLPIELELFSFRVFRALTAWRFTQTVLLNPPSFLPGRDLHEDVVESIPIDLFYSMQGLPMYIPVASKESWGVLVALWPLLSKEDLMNINAEDFSESIASKGERFFVLHFIVVLKKPDEFGNDFDSAYFLTPKVYLNQEEKELDRLNGVIPISRFEKIMSACNIIPSRRRLYMDALKAVLFLSKNLPSPNWIADKKAIQLKKDPETGTLIAQPPAHTNTVILTPDSCIELNSPNNIYPS